MKFNEHYGLQGKHAFLGASKWNWINYDEDKLITTFQNFENAEKGTRLHALAASMITEGIKAQSIKQTFNMYVNDAIGFRMTPEVLLFYSYNVFGTTDAIRYDEKKKFLRIHDLKTGVITQAHMEQLMIYAALFCLEYKVNPYDIFIELRIYQNNEIVVINNDNFENLQEYIEHIEKLMVSFDKRLERYKSGD